MIKELVESIRNFVSKMFKRVRAWPIGVILILILLGHAISFGKIQTTTCTPPPKPEYRIIFGEWNAFNNAKNVINSSDELCYAPIDSSFHPVFQTVSSKLTLW